MRFTIEQFMEHENKSRNAALVILNWLVFRKLARRKRGEGWLNHGLVYEISDSLLSWKNPRVEEDEVPL
jgi:hypothetical protein